MSSNKERVFVTGASGNIGIEVVRGLVKKGIATTAYVRDEQKAKDLFKDELKTGHLAVAVGTYTSVDAYEKAIRGHTRLFLLVAEISKPDGMSKVKATFAKIAYEQGVRQILDISSASVGTGGRDGIIAYVHTTAEEKLWALADENSEQRSLVILRPVVFMINHLRVDVHQIKGANKLLACGPPSAALTWIDTKDIADCAVVVLSESVEKHDRMVYELGAEIISNEQRAAIFSKVLGRSITYEEKSIEEMYNMYMKFGMSHAIVYNYISFALNNISKNPTPQVSILLGRPLRTLEQWIRENAQAFQ